MKILYLFVFIIFSNVLKAQFTVGTAYEFCNYGSSKSLFYEGSDILDARISLSGGYELKLKGSGVTLTPMLSVAIAMGGSAKSDNYELQRYALSLPLKFYPFNIKGDCGCPDFSLRNKFFEKHFFILINNSIGYTDKTYKIKQFAFDAGTWDIKTGIGLGLSIPLSKKIVLDPLIGYSKIFKERWEGLMLNTIDDTDFSPSFIEVMIFFRYNFNE